MYCNEQILYNNKHDDKIKCIQIFYIVHCEDWIGFIILHDNYR